jgi:hypothetical protein
MFKISPKSLLVNDVSMDMLRDHSVERSMLPNLLLVRDKIEDGTVSRSRGRADDDYSEVT